MHLISFRPSNVWRLPLLILAAITSHTVADAQYLGLNLRGDMGLKSGSQAGPGIYLIAPLWYHNDYDGLRNANGDDLLSNANVKINLFTVPAVAIITKAKILGATYGAQVVPMVMDNRLQLAFSDRLNPINRSSGYGFGDMYVQPINLGWRKPRADFLAAYGLYLPTGRSDLTLDMWAHEIQAGTTVYLDEGKKWHVAGTGSFEIHQRKRSTDVRVGDILTVEGGVGRSFLKGAANAGMAYVAQWKVTDDSGSDIPAALPRSKNRVYGLGPDISMPIFAKGTLVGLIGARFIWEFGGRTSFEGKTVAVSFTLAKLNVN